MSHETFTLDELAQHLGRDRRELEKLIQRGRIPGRKVGDDWVFSQAEIYAVARTGDARVF